VTSRVHRVAKDFTARKTGRAGQHRADVNKQNYAHDLAQTHLRPHHVPTTAVMCVCRGGGGVKTRTSTKYGGTNCEGTRELRSVVMAIKSKVIMAINSAALAGQRMHMVGGAVTYLAVPSSDQNERSLIL
jgi:hypothetical protein